MPKKKIEFTIDIGYMSYKAVLEPDNPVTKCVIFSKVDSKFESFPWHLKAFGIGVRKHGDAYDLETGCRCALRSALRMIPETEIRKAVWAKYLELFPPKQRVKPPKRPDPNQIIRVGAVGIPMRRKDFDEFRAVPGSPFRYLHNMGRRRGQ